MEGEAKSLYKQAKEDMEDKDYDKAIDRLNRALEIYRDLGKQKDVTKCAKELEKAYEKQAEAINKIADELFKQEKYEEAINYYKQSVELIKETSKKKDQSKYDKELRKSYENFAHEINKQADQLKKEKNYDVAIELYIKSIDLMKKSYNSDKVNELMKELGKTAGEHAKDINKQADREFKQKNYGKSLELYEKSVEVADKSNNAKLISNLTKELYKNYEVLAENLEESAEKLIDEDNYNEAIDKLSNALRFIEKTRDDKKVKKLRKKISNLYEDNAEKINKTGDEAFKRKDYEKAIDIYHSSFEMAKESQNQKLIDRYRDELNKSFEKYAEVVNKQGDEAFEANDFEKAEMIYIKSLGLATESGKDSLMNEYSKELRKTREKWAEKTKESAKQAIKDRQYEISIRNFEQALEIIKRTEDEDVIKEYLEDLQDAYEDWADKLNKRGDNAYDAKNYEQAVELYSKAFDLIEKTEDEGKIKKYRKDRDKAMKKLT
ncbi:MAG: tetratricopeptide repeat protein [Candidatus Helarchaeota archaeon]|nr:tetratricopeptide repeat protein [Candidatus Helarchaeota archaeon]